MTRQALSIVLAAVLGSLGLSALGEEPPGPDERANVVLILTDDMRLDDLEYMPHVQALLAGRGVTFEQALSPYPLCCPARASLLTGQYAHNHGVQGNRWPRGGFRRLNHDNTLAVWLERNGYNTAFVGKYLNDHASPDAETIPPGWRHWNAAARGISNYRNLTTNDDGELVSHAGIYASLVIDAKSANALDVYTASSQPFFLWSSYVAPHGECNPAACWHPPPPAPIDDGAYAGLAVPDSEAINEQDMSDKGPFMRVLPLLSTTRLEELAVARSQRIESLQAVDRGVAHLVDRLDASGEWDNTYVIFTSDNGYSLGEHRLADRKLLGYEENVRIPLIITGPGIPTGETRRQAVTLGDLTTTVTEIAGIPGGRVQDGESLLPLARGEVADLRDRMVPIEAGPINSRSPGWLYRGVRTDRYTLIRWRDDFVELYDRMRDPELVDSVAYDDSYADVRAYLEDATTELEDCRGEGCLRFYEGPGPSATR